VTDTDRLPEEPRTYTVPEGRLEWLQDKLASLAKRAAKLGVPAPRLVVLAHRVEERKDYDHPDWEGKPRLVRSPVVDLRVEGEAPRLPGGWELFATLQHTEAGNLLRTVPGHEGGLPARFRTLGPEHCDHCGLPRNRKDTYVVAKDGDFKQVGSQCIKDFLGHTEPERLAQWATMLESLRGALDEEDAFLRSGGAPEVYALEAVVALAAGAVRAHGWVSKSQVKAQIEAQGYSDFETTADRVRHNLDPRWLAKAREKSPKDVITPDFDLAQKTLAYWAEYFATKSPYDFTDFDQNMKVVTGLADLDDRMIGYAAYLPQGYLKAQEREAQRAQERRERQAQGATSTFQGKVGERLPLDLTVTFVKYLPSDWGVSYLTKLADAGGNAYVWFASTEYQKGSHLVGKATVKAHKARDGVQETQITRGSFTVA
jgi:hypothetical protein